MKLTVVGVSHNNSPIEIREQAAFIRRTAKEGITELIDGTVISEALILSTCNRSEIYAVSENPEAAEQRLKHFYLNKSSQLQQYLYAKSDTDALVHLYRVVSGLDSMILGEDQILGQTKDAVELAKEAGGMHKYLTKIFREAITFSKHIKTEYKISETPTSLSSTAVKYLMRRYPDYSEKKVMIIGSGKMGILALRYMAAEGFKDVIMTNRTYHAGDEYKNIYAPLDVVEYSKRYDLLQDVDIVITATASPHLVLKKEMMTEPQKELLIIDLALPKDADPAIADFERAEILTIDDFSQIMDEKQEEQLRIAEKIAGQIQGKVDELEEWIAKSRVDNIIAAVNGNAQNRAEETIEILNSRYHFEGKDLEFLEKIVHSKFREMVMPSIKQLKSIDSEQEALEYEKTFAYLTRAQA